MNNRKLRIFAIVGICASMSIFAIHAPLLRAIFAFLSVNKPVKAKVLVVEGWLFDYMLKDAADEFFTGNYTYCVISGQRDRGVRYDSSSAEAVLINAGIDSSKIKRAASYKNSFHRTYQQANSVKNWLKKNDPSVKSINVFTGGPHGRKTWTVYKRVLGKDFEVGIISCRIQHYNADRWWTSKRGLLVTTKFAIGYIYALVWPFK
jgi:hypothetical protein